MNMAAILEGISSAGLPLEERLRWYAESHGLTFNLSDSPGRALRKSVFDNLLVEARTRLSAEDQAFLSDVAIITTDHEKYTDANTTGRSQNMRSKRNYINAWSSRMPNDKFEYIGFCRKSIMQQAHANNLDREAIVDWLRRLFLHEIGHIRDLRTDEEMARVSNY